MYLAEIILVYTLAAAVILGAFVAFELVRRRLVVQRWAINYDQTRDQLFQPHNPGMRTVEISFNSQAFVWPQVEAHWGSAWLELPIETTRLGRLLDPCLEFRVGDIVVRQYVERGARGKRWFNVSGLLRDGDIAGRKVEMRAEHLSWSVPGARLHLLPEVDTPAGPVLVLAPHPDDAEIAAFGVYSRQPSWVVTVTLGDHGTSHYAQFFPTEAAAYSEKARVRVWDSVHIPQLGGVPADQVANLGYFDGRLNDMYAAPETPVAGVLTGERDISRLRQNPLDKGVPPREATWRNLVNDMKTLVARVRPSAIVLPHPQLDPHPDHQFTTVALIEALEQTGFDAELPSGKLLFYSNHAIGTELYPFGANDGVMSVPPMHDTDAYFESILLVPLDSTTRLRKQIALEAHHDLRPPPPKGRRSFMRVLKDAIRAPYVHLVGADNDYVRRAARANELFFVVDYARARRVKADFLARRAKH
jgi:LmbE family N-acetylglucosaminyl deacetylase